MTRTSTTNPNSLRSPGWAALALALSMVATGCRHGPDSATLHAQIQARLDERFEPGLFQVKALERSGSYGFTDSEDATARLLVYFKARLALGRDYGLADAETLNAGVLASLLGATPRGITGVDPEGNHAGDEFRVFGSATFLHRDGAWVPARQRPRDADASMAALRAQGENLSSTERWLRELGEEYRGVANRNQREHLRAFEEETHRARRAIHLRLNRLDGIPTLVTGGAGSEYSALGLGLSRAARARRVPLHDYHSAGSVENCRLVAERRADFGFVQNDIAFMAFHGEALFEGARPLQELRAVCSLYPEALHLVVRKGSGVAAVPDLAGRRVAIGPAGSGTRVNSLAVLAAYGLAAGDLAARRELDTEEALEGLRGGELDAVFLTTAYPAQPIEQLAGTLDLALVPIEGEAAERLVVEHPFFSRVTIPRSTYSEQEEDVRTLGVTALVVTHRETPDEQVQGFLALLFESHRVLEEERDRSPVRPLRAPERPAPGSRVAGFVSRRTATLGLSIPVHPAAQRVLQLEAPGTGDLPGGN